METITALDTQTLQDVGLVQPAAPAEPAPPVTDPVTQPGAGTEPPVTAPGTPVEQPATPQEIEIEGIGKVTPAQIKEWQSGSLRQSDYTKKTQEIARQREELKEAQELFEYLKANPHLVQQLQDAEGKPVNREIVSTVTPEHGMMKEVFYNQMSMMIDKQIADIKSTYGVDTIDEVALFDKARELHTNDLDFVYRALNFNKTPMDEKALIERAKEELRKELEADKVATRTIVGAGNPPITQTQGTLTDAEKRVAAGMGMKEEEYLKWKGR
jgi:hypothetical protein